MKKCIYFIVLMAIFGCSDNSSDNTVEPPIALDDTVTTQENTAVIIDVLNNDTLINNATLNDFDAVSVNGGSITQSSSKLVYTPLDGFTGTDTFEYTICDGFANPNCDTASVSITVTDEGDAIAVDDAFEVLENASITFNVLSNDTLLDGAELTSVDASSTNGEVVLNNDYTISYTSNNGFSGEDTFTYTLCDNDETPTCVTATVTITVIDEGNPEAFDDIVNISENSSNITISVLENDTVIDDAVVSSIDNALSVGAVVLNTDGTVSYTPPADFTGTDSFTYTICDDDATPYCSTATVNIKIITPMVFNMPSELMEYYEDVIFTTDTDVMLSELETVTETKHTTKLTYGQRHNYLYDADEDMSNTDNVVLIYSGESRYWEEYDSPTNTYEITSFNTEHIYPQSLLNDSEEAPNDIHHMRVCDQSINSQRSNHPYREGSGSYLLTNQEWYPGDDWKGDVARMVMYVHIRYGDSFAEVGSLELFLKWNAEDPVSEFEKQRNNVIYGAQGNRNPFIDNPYLATLIWGGDAAENTWE
ncbi:Ig-like domain-containing protein [Neotamlana laminarinivorans]|uniref:Ig-like domain-containing protein n=1 Tax=Neotamlana laminarinivorans TaxID=2883124 RepID=A0A9X1HXI5_9FLAO|nr:Ig-like domain-containing protein [Tamlana laminarinivorans]MCB4797974.1 Ig-like domain-containing protein [Tamlana laminarinivorans]